MTTQYESIPSEDGRTFKAYVSQPEVPNGHAVIVLQEIFGVTKHVRDIADRFAEDGYLAYAPDLFWRLEPGVELTHSKEDMQKAFSFVERYDDADGMADIRSTAKHIRALTEFNGKVATAGLCMGGRLAFLAAGLPEVQASVGFYGVGIEGQLGVTENLKQPLMLHFGSEDPYVSTGAREQITAALSPKKVVIYVYPGANHGFYTRGSEDDIKLARERTNRFLEHALAG